MTEVLETTPAKKSHSEWRKLAKKIRRKKIRQKSAEERKRQDRERENSPTYLTELAKKRILEEHELEKEEEERNKRNDKWLEDEVTAQKEWREQQRLKALAEEDRLREQERLRREKQAYQEKVRKRKEEQERRAKEEEKKREALLTKINEFMEVGGDIPHELTAVTETNPGKELCLFYQKIGSCRFGSFCSRNHQLPGISTVLLFPHFYTHFKIEHSKSSEYDTDIGLEFEDSETYLHFKEFYDDIVPEFKSLGLVKMVKVCCNFEHHLRGNVYVQYSTFREALVAYRKFQGRWYGGKQINVEFVNIPEWSSAVCGDFAKLKCPKGNACNFLHVFRNPRNEYAVTWNRNKQFNSNSTTHSSQNKDDDFNRTPPSGRNWRWSESPEPVNRHTKRRESKRRESSHSRRRSKSRSRSRSRSRRKHTRSRSPNPTRSRSQSRDHRHDSKSRSRKRKEVNGDEKTQKEKNKDIKGK